MYINNNGTFSQAWESPEIEETLSVAWGDMNGDGLDDLAVGNNGAPNRVYTSTGTYVVTLIAYNDEGCSNTYTDTVTSILPSPFSINKTAPSSVVSGQPLTYTIIVSNTSGTATSSVVITDALPSGAFYVGCGGGACSESGGVVTWSGLTVPPYSAINVTFVVTACSGPLVNSAYGVASWSEGTKQARSVSRRPNRSATGPTVAAPTPTPTREIVAAKVRAGRSMPRCWVCRRVGITAPSATRSNPSSATANQHSTAATGLTFVGALFSKRTFTLCPSFPEVAATHSAASPAPMSPGRVFAGQGPGAGGGMPPLT